MILELPASYYDTIREIAKNNAPGEMIDVIVQDVRIATMVLHSCILPPPRKYTNGAYYWVRLHNDLRWEIAQCIQREKDPQFIFHIARYLRAKGIEEFAEIAEEIKRDN